MLKLVHITPHKADEKLRLLQEGGCKICNLLTLPLSLDVAMKDALTGSAECQVVYGILYDDPGSSVRREEVLNAASVAVSRLRESEDRAWRSELRRAQSQCRKLEAELAQLKATYVADVKVEAPVM